MAKKSSVVYVCGDCGNESPKWAGRCASCGAWNTLVESVAEPAEADSNNRFKKSWTGKTSGAVTLRDVKGSNYQRIHTGMAELDRVLGGGLVPGSIILLGGDPGIGKSTLLLQTTGCLSKTLPVMYATGEESTEQVALRAERLNLGDSTMRLLPEIELEKIEQHIHAEKPKVVVIDSIQTIFSSALQSAPGTVAQVRECAAQLTRLAKSQGVSLILVGHVTKDGSLAGPRVLEHMVDAVLYFEGEAGSPFRVIRAHKNRFGSSNEIGVFNMGDAGLEEVTNPSSMFLTAHDKPVSGCCILGAMEGNRPFLVEVQGLVEDAPTPNPKRYASGIDTNRLQMLLAVLNKHAGLEAFEQNVYIKVVGGVRLTEPAADLAVLMAAHSSLTGRPLPPGLLVFGEVGLAGELRAVPSAEVRLKEAAKLGFTSAIIPSSCKIKGSIPGMHITAVSRIDAAINALRELRAAA